MNILLTTRKKTVCIWKRWCVSCEVGRALCIICFFYKIRRWALVLNWTKFKASIWWKAVGIEYWEGLRQASHLFAIPADIGTDWMPYNNNHHAHLTKYLQVIISFKEKNITSLEACRKHLNLFIIQESDNSLEKWNHENTSKIAKRSGKNVSYAVGWIFVQISSIILKYTLKMPQTFFQAPKFQSMWIRQEISFLYLVYWQKGIKYRQE